MRRTSPDYCSWYLLWVSFITCACVVIVFRLKTFDHLNPTVERPILKPEADMNVKSLYLHLILESGHVDRDRSRCLVLTSLLWLQWCSSIGGDKLSGRFVSGLVPARGSKWKSMNKTNKCLHCPLIWVNPSIAHFRNTNQFISIN